MNQFPAIVDSLTSLVAAAAGLVAAIATLLNRGKLHAIKKDTQIIKNGTTNGSENAGSS